MVEEERPIIGRGAQVEVIALRELIEIRVVPRRQHVAQRACPRIPIGADQFGEAEFARGLVQLGKIGRTERGGANDDGRKNRRAARKMCVRGSSTPCARRAVMAKLTTRPVSLTLAGLYQRETV